MANNVCRVGDIVVVTTGGGRRAASMYLARVIRFTEKGFVVRICSFYAKTISPPQIDETGRYKLEPPKWHLWGGVHRVPRKKVLRITMHSLPQEVFEIFDNMALDANPSKR